MTCQKKLYTTTWFLGLQTNQPVHIPLGRLAILGLRRKLCIMELMMVVIFRRHLERHMLVEGYFQLILMYSQFGHSMKKGQHSRSLL
uniref:Uncharacterized protein n=1 Tax=Arundo donax TaxID=35708 RepID=A0A0A9EX30_ARUDO